MQEHTRKKLFISVIIASLGVLFLFSKPLIVDRFSYDEAWYYIMWVSWLLGMVIMTWQVILWIRPMFNWITKDFFWINGLHKRLGIWTLMALIFHPIASVISYGTSWLYVFSLDFSSFSEGRISVGKIAFDLILIVLVSSVISRKLLSYRSRHRMHLLSYPAFIWVWFHARYTGTMIAEFPAVRWYWIGIGAVLIVAMIVRIAYQYGYLKIAARMTQQLQKTTDIYELSLSLSRPIHYVEWQFIYLQAHRWGESHPFTILSYNKEKNIVRIAYKVYGKFTSELAWLSTNAEVYIDGPYGDFMHNIATIDAPIVCIAAWIWITPFYDVICNHSATKDIQLMYLNKKENDIVYEKELESHLQEDQCVHILSREQDASKQNYILNTRITPEIIKDTLGEKLLNAQFYLCGGWAVIQEVTTMLTMLGVPKQHIDFEPFTM